MYFEVLNDELISEDGDGFLFETGLNFNFEDPTGFYLFDKEHVLQVKIRNEFSFYFDSERRENK